MRSEYLKGKLNRIDLDEDPFYQFDKWYKNAETNMVDAFNCMSLATVDHNMQPSVRIVLLKSYSVEGFSFFSNYESKKGNHLIANSKAAILFFWPQLEQQIRIEGEVQKSAEIDSDNYFNAREFGSKVAAIISPQSKVIENRQYLENAFNSFISNNTSAIRPISWGGYILKPSLFEFWQGRENRLNDRFEYTMNNNGWNINRLAP